MTYLRGSGVGGKWEELVKGREWELGLVYEIFKIKIMKRKKMNGALEHVHAYLTGILKECVVFHGQVL